MGNARQLIGELQLASLFGLGRTTKDQERSLFDVTGLRRTADLIYAHHREHRRLVLPGARLASFIVAVLCRGRLS